MCCHLSGNKTRVTCFHPPYPCKPNRHPHASPHPPPPQNYASAASKALAAKDQEHAPGTQNAPAFLRGILLGDAGSRSDRCEAKAVFQKEPRLLPFGMAVGARVVLSAPWLDNKIHRHSPPLKTQKTPKNGKKRLFWSDWGRPVSGSFLLCNPLCLRGFEVVRDTGFEPVTPTVSRRQPPV